MNWVELFSTKRFGETSPLTLADTRSRFDQDYDRIIFSYPFRKLQDKTQVFPLPEDDFVHTRLTHSLEVSSVGRSLGKEVGRLIIKKHPELSKQGIQVHDFGAIVASACLTHDLGNPPFGHSGEEGISNFYSNTGLGNFFKEKVTEPEWLDLTNFEGNAQGFRILNHPMYGGLKLTQATLAAFTKYPCGSSSQKDKKRKSQKKYGYYQSESKLFHELATNLGLIKLTADSWIRHPLAFLVEAADDICYNIIDLEDGTRLGLVGFEETKQLFAEIIGDRFSNEKLEKLNGLNEKLGSLRALAISKLIDETVENFLSNEENILTGDFDEALTDLIPSAGILKEVSRISIKKIYRSKQVLEREAAGFEIIEKLMSKFTHAAYEKVIVPTTFSSKSNSIIQLLPEAFKIQLDDNGLSTYECLMIISDFISGMTDSAAVKLYKTIHGFELPIGKH